MGKNNDLIFFALIIVGAYLLVNKLGTGFKNMFGSIGIGNTTEDEEREQVIETKEKKGNYFLPGYWQKPPAGRKARLTTRAKAEQLAKEIWNSVGAVYDTPNQALAAFKELQYKTQISWLAYIFKEKYNRDLQTWLSDKFDTDAQRKVYLQILDYTNKLPEGFIK